MSDEINSSDLDALDEVETAGEETDRERPSFDVEVSPPVEDPSPEDKQEGTDSDFEAEEPDSIKAAENRERNAREELRRARARYEKAHGAYARASRELAKLRQPGTLPLHELNRISRDQNRVEDRRRFKAQEAIEDLKGHFRTDKRRYPIHPSARGAVKAE